ncbi:MAG: 3',5'-cyclic-nucleotide phosphodiesterase, partial [Gammaproteobacteria bacterium]
MKVRVLGCSGGIAKDLRTTTFLVNDEILFDAGTGVGELSLDEMLAIKHVVITHAHLDHVCGLALMLASI